MVKVARENDWSHVHTMHSKHVWKSMSKFDHAIKSSAMNDICMKNMKITYHYVTYDVLNDNMKRNNEK